MKQRQNFTSFACQGKLQGCSACTLVPLNKVKSDLPVPDEISDYIDTKVWEEITSARELSAEAGNMAALYMETLTCFFIPIVPFLFHPFWSLLSIKEQTNDQLKIISKKYYKTSKAIHVTIRHLNIHTDKIPKSKRPKSVVVNQKDVLLSMDNISPIKTVSSSSASTPQSTHNPVNTLSFSPQRNIDIGNPHSANKVSTNHDTRNTSLTMSFENDHVMEDIHVEDKQIRDGDSKQDDMTTITSQ